MIDFCVLRYRRTAPITTVDIAQLTPTTQLLLTGTDFRGVTEVKINDQYVSSFEVIDDSHMVVALPPSLSLQPIQSIAVFVDVPNVNGADAMELRVTGGMRTGIDRLTQMVLLLLFTTPGTDIFEPEAGGGLVNLIGGDISADDYSAIVGAVSQAISRVVSYILRKQQNRPLSAADRLVGVDVLSVNTDVEAGQTAIELRVVSEVASSTVLMAVNESTLELEGVA